jgi:tRNA (uracil-5-)-methyltransferase
MIELEELVDVKDNFYLYQDDKTFYQPNKYLMPKMIEFSLSLISNPRDLLELYCGSGTFTVPMSRYFNKIFATENNRASIGYLNKSIDRNNIINISQSRLSDTELTEAFNGRIFRRMNDISLDDYDFSHVLVDPPRLGLNENVVNILNRFENIIYISCNPETFERDIINLKGYKIDKLEVFDQFSNTPHLELIALLTKI